MSEWLFVGTCPMFQGPVPDSESISIGGLNPWRYQWQTLRGGKPIILPDPLSSLRKHWLKVYEIEKDGLRVTFAGGCIAEGLSVFYIPACLGDSGALVAKEPEYEGYWWATFEDTSALPWPLPDPSWTAREAFLGTLDDVEAKAERVVYRGLSNCRLCGCRNGREGLRLSGWEWPAGYRHYIADHEVCPSVAFEILVLKEGTGS